MKIRPATLFSRECIVAHWKRILLTAALLLPPVASAQQLPSPAPAPLPVPVAQADDRRVTYAGKPGTIFKRPNTADSAVHAYLNLDGQDTSFELVSIGGSQTAFILLKRPDISITADEQGKLSVADSGGKAATLEHPEVTITPGASARSAPMTYRDSPVRTYTDFTVTPVEDDPAKVKIELKTGAQTSIIIQAQRGKNPDGTLSSSKFYLMGEDGGYTEYEKKEASVLPDGQQKAAALDVKGFIRNTASAKPTLFNFYTKTRPLEARVIEGQIQYWLRYADDKPPIQVHPFTKLGGGSPGPLETIDPLPFLVARALNRKAIQRLEFEANYSNLPTIWRAEATKDGGFVVVGGYERPQVQSLMDETVKAHGGQAKISK